MWWLVDEELSAAPRNGMERISPVVFERKKKEEEEGRSIVYSRSEGVKGKGR